MADAAVNCPLCFQSCFTSVSSLCLNLISVTTRLLECPICRETLFGLDKFTIHLFSHTFNQPSLVSLQPIGASNVSSSNNQNQTNINNSVSETISTEVPINSGVLRNKDIVQNVIFNDNKCNDVNINDVNHNNGLERPNEMSVKFIESNRFSEKSPNTLGSPELKEYINKIECGIKDNEEFDNVNSKEDIKTCESLKKNLEPFLKYNNKSTKQRVKKDSRNKNLNYISNSFISQGIVKNILSSDVMVGGLPQCSDGNSKDSDRVNDKVLSLTSPGLLNTGDLNDVACSNNTQGFLSDTGISFIYDKIPNDTVKPLLRINDVASPIDNSGKSFNINNLHQLNKSSKIISLEKDILSTENTCRITVEDGEIPQRVNVAMITPLSPVMKKEVASQAIQTVEESFTKTNNRFNEAAVLFINENKNKKSDCNHSDDTIQSKDLTITNNYYDSDDNDIYSCDICLFKFPDEQILSMHKQLVHTHNDKNFNDKKLFACHLCTKSFKMRGSLMVHRRVAHPTTSVLKKLEAVAITNGESASGTFNMSNCIASSTDQLSPDQLFSCNMCGKTFKKESHLMQHEKTHEVKQWECDVCSKSFSTKYFLKKHRRLHTGEMPYSCSTCGKSFTFQQSYHKHLLYHSDEKPYVCCDCGRAFKELSTLHNHQRIHTGEKPFSCETCGKCFRQRVSYLVHRRIHTGVMPYKCSICNRSFRYKVSERTHKCVPAAQQHSLTGLSVVTPIGQISNESCQIGDKKNDVVSKFFTSESPTTDTCNFPLEKNTTEELYNSSNSTNNRGNSSPDMLNIDWRTDQQSSAYEIINNNNNNDKSVNIEDVSSENDLNKKPRNSKSSAISQPDLFETTDFFSLILSPTISSPSLLSPSEHLRHLTLSPNSSQNWDSSSPVEPFPDVHIPDSNSNDKNSKNNNGNNNNSDVINISNNDGHSSGDNGILETINEQSFKELLYDVPHFL